MPFRQDGSEVSFTFRIRSSNPGIVLAACWAHVLRRFRDALPDHPEAERALSWIGALYDIDDRAVDDLVHRAELRRSESRAVLDETSKLHGVNPAEYLYAAIVAADRGVVLMPWEFANAREVAAADSSSASSV
jgi:hypothetical protein